MGALFKSLIDDNYELDSDDFIELQNRIYTSYGWPNVKVEITDEQFKRIIRRAVSYLNTYSPKVEYILEHVYSNQSDYVLNKDVFVGEDYGTFTKINPYSFTLQGNRTADYIVNTTRIYLNNLECRATVVTYSETDDLTTIVVTFGNTAHKITDELYTVSYSNTAPLYIHSVQDVYVSTDYLMGLGMPYQNLIAPAMTLGASYDTTLLSDYVSLFAAYDLAKRMFGTQPMVKFIHPNIARIDPIPYIDTTFCFVITVNHETNLGSLGEYEFNWFLRFMEIATGKVIGETRRKYSGMPLPAGSLETSGSALYSECDAKEKELIEEIKGRRKLPSAYICVG